MNWKEKQIFAFMILTISKEKDYEISLLMVK